MTCKTHDPWTSRIPYRRKDRRQNHRSQVMEETDNRTYDLLFSVRRSVRYHNRRRRFYETWNAITVTTAAVGGSAAGIAYYISGFVEGIHVLPVAASCIVALLSAIDIGVGTSRNANLHAELARKFIELEKRFAHGKNLTDDEHEDLVRSRLEIETVEPTTLRLLDLMCHFELLRATGDKRKHPKIPFLRRCTLYLLSHDGFVQGIAEKHVTSD